MSTTNFATPFSAARPRAHSRCLNRWAPTPSPLQRPSSSPCWSLGWHPPVRCNSRSTRLNLSSRPKGREVQRLPAPGSYRAPRRWRCGDLRCTSPQQAGTVLYTHRRLRSRSLKNHLLDRWRFTAWATPAMAHPAFIRSTRPSPYPRVRSPTNCSGVWSRQRCRNPFHESVDAVADPHRRFLYPSAA